MDSEHFRIFRFCVFLNSTFIGHQCLWICRTGSTRTKLWRFIYIKIQYFQSKEWNPKSFKQFNDFRFIRPQKHFSPLQTICLLIAPSLSFFFAEHTHTQTHTQTCTTYHIYIFGNIMSTENEFIFCQKRENFRWHKRLWNQQ